MRKPAAGPALVLRFRLYRALRCIACPALAFRITLARRAQA